MNKRELREPFLAPTLPTQLPFCAQKSNGALRLPFPPHAPLMAENKIAVVVFALVMIGIIGVVIYYLTKPKDAPK